jgi:hypothetical protein
VAILLIHLPGAKGGVTQGVIHSKHNQHVRSRGQGKQGEQVRQGKQSKLQGCFDMYCSTRGAVRRQKRGSTGLVLPASGV